MTLRFCKSILDFEMFVLTSPKRRLRGHRSKKLDFNLVSYLSNLSFCSREDLVIGVVLWRLTPFCVNRPCHQLEPRIEKYIILLTLSILVTNEKSVTRVTILKSKALL